MRSLFLFFLFAILPLLADPKDSFSLAVTEGEPDAFVDDCVSAITGDLYLKETDALIQACVPLRMPRQYLSGDGKGTLAGWSFINHLSVTYKGGEKEHKITIQEPNGSTFVFKCSAEEVIGHFRKKKHPPKFRPPSAGETPGLTNTSQENISGHSNLKNASVRLEDSGRYLLVYCSDQTTRSYKVHHHHKHFKDVFKREESRKLKYLLETETLPSGHKIAYDYDHEDRLKTVSTTNPNGKKTYASASFYYHHKDKDKIPNVDVILSDGRSLHYRYQEKSGDSFLLKCVGSPECPEENILYHGRDHHSGNLVSRISLPDLRYYDVEYYREGHNDVGGVDIKVKDKHDPRFLRVKELKAPVGEDHNPYVTHRFFYAPDERYTDVRDVNNMLTRYHYSPSMRLETIAHFGQGDVLSYKETFEWSDSDLKCRSLYDAANLLIFSRRFHYDDRGNVLKEELSGDLSGQGKSETYKIKRDYSEDGRDLLLKEEQNGKTTLYTYLPNTNLLSAKYICEKDQIKIRSFYDYNGDNVLIREIQDDGTGFDKRDFSGVKTRLIKVITPMPGGSFVDMPQIIEEKYWDGVREVDLKKTVYSYTTGGRIETQSIYDAKGELRYTLKNTYDSLGRLETETNAIGQVATHTYDGAGNKKTVSAASGKRKSLMEYDCSNRLKEVKEIGLDGITHITQYKYDGKHNKTACIDSFGNMTRYVPDPFGNVIETHLPKTLDEQGNEISPVLLSTYDCAGREITHTDAKGYVTKKRYNARSQLTYIQHPDGFEEHFIFNLDGTLRMHVDAEGYMTSHTYDVFGRCKSTTDPRGEITTYTYDSLHLISTQDAEGYITTYTYDGAGRKIAEEKNKERIEYTYDELNRLHSVKTDDLICFTEYDLLNRVIEERQEDIKGNLLSKVTYDYDEAGNKKSITRSIMGEECQEQFEYDSFDRLILHTDALGYQTTIEYDENHKNNLGQRVLLKITTDALGQKTFETFDSLGRKLSTEIQNSRGATCSLEEKYYDRNNNLCRQVSTIFPQKALIETQWRYDNRNRLSVLNEPLGKTTTYTYTPRGYLDQTIKPDRVILKRDYDPNGNLEKLASSDGSIAYNFKYNALNQLTSTADLTNNTTTVRTFDPKGRVLTEKLANNLNLTNSYDLQGRRTKLTLPHNNCIIYTYDAIHLREVSRHDASETALYTHIYEEYDLSHHLLSQQLISNLGVVTYSISPLGKREAIDCSFFSQHVVSYDPVGNITALATQSQTTTYTYDDLYQLTQENGPLSHSYAYDSHFNRLQKDDQTYVLNALNQLSNVEYDANGNPRLAVDAKYTYDALDRLTCIETPSQRFVFTYDSFHRRLTKTIYEQTHGVWQCINQYFYFYDGQNEIGSTDANGKITQLRVLGDTSHAEIGAAIAMELEGRAYAPIHDLLGNVISLISLNGSVAESYRYDSFGNHISTSHLNNPWRFASKRLDETGLIYYGRRYLDPITGRWITPDPLGFEGGINLYAFVQNNPLMHLDLYGLSINSNPPPVAPPMVTTKMVSPQPVSTKQIAQATSPTPSVSSSSSGNSKQSILKNYSIGTLEGMGHCGIALAGGVADLGQLFSAPFYFLTGQWDTWGNHWDMLQNSHAYLHSSWQQQMQNLLPVNQRLSYYHHIANTSQSVFNGGLLGITAVPSLALRSMQSAVTLGSKTAVQATQLNRFHQAASGLSETGQNNIRILRGWAKSKGWEKLPNSSGAPETWGNFNQAKNKFDWHLKIKPEASFREGLQADSNIPRASARLEEGIYTNPFTGEVGGIKIGGHIPLETLYYK